MVNQEILKQYEIFQNLSDLELTRLSEASKFINISKKQRVYDIKDEVKSVYLVHKGSIKLGSDVEKEKSLVKHIAYESDVFGENIFAGSTRNEYAEAINSSVIIEIEIKWFESVIKENHSFANRITEVIIERINTLEQRMKNFIFMKAQQRISHFLKQTGLKRGIKIGMDEILINHGMSHKDISFLTDTSRQTVTRVLSELKSSNLIHFSARKPNKILIRNIAAL